MDQILYGRANTIKLSQENTGINLSNHTHVSTLAWQIPWTEEPGRLQSIGSRRVGHDWAISLSCIGEGNGNPLQCSCLENPRDGGAWLAAVYGVAQSWTRLKQLSSSSMFLLPFSSLFGVVFVDLFSSLVFLDCISPFNICCKAGLMVLNSLNFCLSEKLFIFPPILNEILARYSNLGCRFFPFSTLNISCHSLLDCRVSVKRSAVKHMGFPLYATCCFFLVVFNILSLCLVFAS